MGWIEPILDELERPNHWSYRPDQPPATEPLALAALVLAAHGRSPPATVALDRLASMQAPDGSLGVWAEQTDPHWATGLAVLAWASAATPAGSPYEQQVTGAVAWILSAQGEALPQTPGLGHNASLIGWAWVEGTHSWSEPTAINLLALKATGHGLHPRSREAARLLIDRLLPAGGCNYGNTVVLGQTLRPHLAPTGLVLAALAGESDPSGRLSRSLDYLARNLSPSTAAMSLAYGLLGLAAHGRTLPEADSWLERAAARTRRMGGAWVPRLALVALAAARWSNPLRTNPAWHVPASKP